MLVLSLPRRTVLVLVIDRHSYAASLHRPLSLAVLNGSPRIPWITMLGWTDAKLRIEFVHRAARNGRLNRNKSRSRAPSCRTEHEHEYEKQQEQNHAPKWPIGGA